MRYCLGIDVGNARVTAAVADGSRVEAVRLGRRSASLPALVHVAPDGTIRTGDDALQAVDLDPTSTARLLPRRLDDPTPIQLGGRTYEIADLLGRLLRDVMNQVTAQRGGPPDHVVFTRPAALGPRGRDLLAAVADRADRPDATTTTGPFALGTWFAGAGRPAPSRFAVYDFGGGSCEVAVLRVGARGVEVAGPVDGVARLGGTELDELVHGRIDSRTGGALTRWDARTREGAHTRDRVLAACARAKETLSRQEVVEVTVPLPSGGRRILLLRTEVETLFRRPVVGTVEALQRALVAADAHTDVVVVAGGSARIPLVTTLIRDSVGPGVRIEHVPEAAVAWGAAQLALRRVQVRAPVPVQGWSAVPGPGAAAPQLGAPLPPGPRPVLAAAERATEVVHHLPVAPLPAPRPPARAADPARAAADPARVANPAPAADPAPASDGTEDGWHIPAIGRPLAVALALLAVVVAVGMILFVVLHRVDAVAGFIVPQPLTEAWWTSPGPLS